MFWCPVSFHFQHTGRPEGLDEGIVGWAHAFEASGTWSGGRISCLDTVWVQQCELVANLQGVESRGGQPTPPGPQGSNEVARGIVWCSVGLLSQTQNPVTSTSSDARRIQRASELTGEGPSAMSAIFRGLTWLIGLRSPTHNESISNSLLPKSQNEASSF